MHNNYPAIFFELTDRCNHTCFYCCKNFKKRINKTLTYEQIDKILSLPKSCLIISGGEPSLEKEKVKYIYENADCPIAINTNLTNWNEEDFLYYKNKIEFNISVPSYIDSIYTNIVHANTFMQLEKNLNLAPKNSHIEIAIHELNRDNIYKHIHWLGIKGYTNFMLQPIYGKCFTKENLQKSIEVVESIFKHNRQYNIEYTSKCCETSVPITHLCDAGLHRLVILINGNIVPCACTKLKVLGNIFSKDFNYEQVLENGREFYYSFPNELQTMCKGYL